MKKNLLSTALIALTALFAMPQSAWADDPVAVSKTATWTFSTWTTSTSITEVTALVSSEGGSYLYVLGNSTSGHNITGAAGSQSLTLSDGTSITPSSPTIYANSAGQNSALSADYAANTTSIDRCFAFKTSVAGTCYVALRFKDNCTSKTLALYFNGTSVDSYASQGSVSGNPDKDLHELKYTSTDGGTFFIKGDAEYRVAMIRFVPLIDVSNSTFTNGSYSETSVSIAEPSSNGYTVTFSVTPDVGYYLASTPTVTGSDESSVTVTDNRNGTYTFTTTKFPVTISAPSTAANPIGTWDFQTWANGSDYINGGTNDEAIHYLERNSNGVLTGRIDTGKETESGLYYTTALPLNGVFGATDTNLQIRKNSSEANNGLFVASNSITSLVIYKLKQGDWMRFNLNNGGPGTITFEDNSDNAKVKKLGSSDVVTNVESDAIYVVQQDCDLGIAFAGSGNKYVYSIEISNTENVSAPLIGTYNNGEVTITNGTTTSSTSTVTTYYTLDGSTPSASHKDGSFTDASKAIQIDQTRIVKAITISSTEVSSDVVTKKITVDAATPATTWDFTSMTSLSYSDDATTIYYNGGNGSNFNYIVGSDIHSKMTWQNGNGRGSLAGETEKYLTGTTPFSINDLTEGDKVYITYTGGQLKVFRGTHGNSLKIGETTITTSGDYTFDSGAEIEVTDVDADYNYIALRQATATAKITKIEINPVYTITNATDNESGITVAITKENDAETDKTFESTFARGTTVTLAATYTVTGKELVWMDGEDNVLTANDDGTVTITMDGNKTIKATLTIPVWTVNDVTVESYTESTAVDGVQIHGNNTSGHAVSVTVLSPAKTGSFSNTDATAYSVSKYLTIPGAVSASTDEIANKAATMRLTANNTESLKEYLAMDVTEAGTLYVLYRPKTATDGRNVYVGFQKNSDNSYTKTIQSATLGTEYTEIKHSGNGAGTFFVYGSIEMKVYAMMFVPETVKTLTTAASPTAGGVITVSNGNATYEGAANGLAIQPNTELTLAATANTGYSFTGWSNNVTSNTITMDDDKTATATFEAVTYPLTITQPATGGSITATVDETSYTESTNVLENKTVTLTAVPADGYQLAGWTNGTDALGDLPKSLINTITMDAAKSATATFEATPAVSGVTAESLWTFDGFDANTILSGKKVYGYNNGIGTLYISGHDSNTENFATVKAGSGAVATEISDNVTNYLYLAGGQNPDLKDDRVASKFTKDLIAFKAGVPGTVSVYMTGTTADTGRYINIYEALGTSGYAIKHKTTTTGNAQLVSQVVSGGANVFIGASEGDQKIYAVKFAPATDETEVTLTPTDDTANRTDFKNFKVSNLTAGTLYYVLPGETATKTYVANESSTINDVKKNGYLAYWVVDYTNRCAYKKKTVEVKIAPTLKLKSVATDASTYTLSYTAGNTLHYTLPGGTEQMAGGDTSTSTEVTVTTTGPITAYQTVGDVVSDTLKTNVYAPTPAIADDGKYDFTTLASLIGKGYTIAMGSYDWGDVVTIGDVTLKKPGPMTSKTLDRFAFTYQNSDNSSNTNWRLVSDGRLRLAKRDAAVYIAILDLQAGNFVTVTHNNASSLTYNSSSTATLENVTTLTSGQSYQVKSSGHLLLSVPGNTSTEFDITQIEIATAEKVTAPTLEARTESGVVVPNAITLRLGASNFGNTVTAYYTTDGTTPSATNGTAMSASGKITVDETSTIKAICISSTGVTSAVSEYAITLPQADKTGSVVYDFNSVISKSKALTFSTTAASSVQVMEKGTSGWEQKGRSDFYPVTDFDSRISVRVGAESVTYDTEAATVKLVRPMAIHNLGVGDEIVIMYSGTGSVINVNSPAGDVFTVADKTVAVGEEISSGAVIKITKTKYANNYIVVGTSGDVYINAIYINSQAPSTVTRPKVALKDVDGDEAIYNITFDAGARLYYWLSTGEETEYRGSDTGSYDLTISKSATLKAWAQYSGLVSDTLTTVIYAPTPAPSENGDYDFTESSDGLPADMEVQLDAASSVTVSGKTLYKPTALTAQTFQDKFAFTETNTTGKIKIRTNRQLAFSKGTDMNMALLNMKKGDIIAFDYTGTINFADPTLVKADAVAAARAMTRGDSDSQMASGTAYVVQQDCNVLMDLVLTSEAVSIAKMYVAAAPGKSDAAAVDFASAAEDEEELEMGGAASVWCAERTAMVKFKRLANSSDNLPIDSKISSENGYGSNTTNGFSSGNRNIAIHALAKGDTVKVRFSGGDVLFYNHASYGNSISRNGKLLVAGDTIHSGDVLKVEKVDYLNNYFVLRLGSGAAISGIFINKQETEKVLMPTATLNSSNALVITSGKSTFGYDVVTNYTTNGTDPSLLNGTGGPYATFEVQLRKNESKTIKVISISESGAMSRILTLTYDGSVLTSIEDVFADREDELTEEKEAVIYDLQGRRVTTMTPGHIYIVNGKKRFYNKR